MVRVATDADRAAIKALQYVLQRKDEVSYMATLVRPEDAARVLERLQHFGDWAERRYEQLGQGRSAAVATPQRVNSTHRPGAAGHRA